MAAPNRVEELRKRYHENPRRFFAPLANEYRKTGFPDRAILLCEKHLGEQPDNLNGLVVYGQTLFESGRAADAKAPFEMALKLDPENLIALRHLGDIAKDAGDNEDARRWYERVLEFDRRNEEVLALLESVGGAQEKEPPSGPSSAPSIVSVASSVRVTTSGEGDPVGIGMIDLDATAPAVEPPSVPRPRVPTPAAKTVEVSPPPKAAKRASLLDIAFDFGEVATPATQAAPMPAAPVLGAEAAEYGLADTVPMPPVAAQPPALEDMPTLITDPVVPSAPAANVAPAESLIEMPPEPVDLGGVGRIEGLEAAEFSADVSPLAGLEPAEFQPEDVAPLADLEEGAFTGLGADAPAEATAPAPIEEAAPEEATGDGALPPFEEAAPAPQAVAEEPEIPPAEPDADFGGTMAFSAARLEELPPPSPPRPTDGLPLLEPFEDEEPASAPAPFVTETMAELYVKQGHHAKAIEVYRQLIAQSPGDASLKEKLARLESAGRTSIEFEAPTEADLAEPTPAPANAMLADMSFDDLDLSTPAPPPKKATPVASPAIAPRPATPSQGATPVRAAPAAPAGPSAREYLAAFARRGFTPLSSPVIPSAPPSAPASAPGSAPDPTSAVPGGGLDLLFGPDVNAEDERAAHRLAGVGALAGPSGGSRLDSLFGEGPSAPLPPELASARPGVARASDKLRFDQFFSATSAPEAAPEPPSAQPDEMQEPGSAPPPEDDDLDQFQGWLRGLTT